MFVDVGGWERERLALVGLPLELLMGPSFTCMYSLVSDAASQRDIDAIDDLFSASEWVTSFVCWSRGRHIILDAVSNRSSIF